MIDNIVIRRIFLTVPSYSSLKSGLEIVWLIILCVLVIAASYFVTKYVGGSQIKKRKNSNFELLDACSLGNHKFLQIVKAGKRYFVISVCKDSVTFIAELNEDEILFKDIATHTYNFNDVLSKYIKKKNSSDKNKDDIAFESNSCDNNDNTDNNIIDDSKG